MKKYYFSIILLLCLFLASGLFSKEAIALGKTIGKSPVSSSSSFTLKIQINGKCSLPYIKTTVPSPWKYPPYPPNHKKVKNQLTAEINGHKHTYRAYKNSKFVLQNFSNGSNINYSAWICTYASSDSASPSEIIMLFLPADIKTGNFLDSNSNNTDCIYYYDKKGICYHSISSNNCRIIIDKWDTQEGIATGRIDGVLQSNTGLTKSLLKGNFTGEIQ